MKSVLHFVLGGSGSGKSRHAEMLAEKSGRQVTYIATCETKDLDLEMSGRIESHRLRRPKKWKVIENRFDLHSILQEEADQLVLLDCLTLWLAYWQSKHRSEAAILADLEMAMDKAILQTTMIVVGDEIGMGLVPELPESRAFRDLCGRANELVAKKATSVELVVAGLPIPLKGATAI